MKVILRTILHLEIVFMEVKNLWYKGMVTKKYFVIIIINYKVLIIKIIINNRIKKKIYTRKIYILAITIQIT